MEILYLALFLSVTVPLGIHIRRQSRRIEFLEFRCANLEDGADETRQGLASAFLLMDEFFTAVYQSNPEGVICECCGSRVVRFGESKGHTHCTNCLRDEELGRGKWSSKRIS